MARCAKPSGPLWKAPMCACSNTWLSQVAAGALAVAGGRAAGVVVTVRKLRPPVAVNMASAAVRIARP